MSEQGVKFGDLSPAEQERLKLARISDELPPYWKDLTDEQKGKLLLAHHEGKVIEYFTLAGGWRECPTPHWSGNYCYRVKLPEPEPVVKEVFFCWDSAWSNLIGGPFQISFNIVDGVPDCSSVKMEPVEKRED